MSHIFLSIKESLTSVLPIAIIVLILSVTCVSLDAGVLVLFLFGTVLLIMGMSFFYDWLNYIYGTFRRCNWKIS